MNEIPRSYKRRKRKKKSVFADSGTDAEEAEAEQYEKAQRRLAKEHRTDTVGVQGRFHRYDLLLSLRYT